MTGCSLTSQYPANSKDGKTPILADFPLFPDKILKSRRFDARWFCGSLILVCSSAFRRFVVFRLKKVWLNCAATFAPFCSVQFRLFRAYSAYSAVKNFRKPSAISTIRPEKSKNLRPFQWFQPQRSKSPAISTFQRNKLNALAALTVAKFALRIF